ncbi:MAG: hypothetical protein WKF92_03025 [Pyrinomonadaceae bacterium]
MDEKLPNSKELFESLFSDLYQNKVIYRERVTMLCEVVRYEVTDEQFEIWLNWLKPLYLGPFEPVYLDTREVIHLGAAFMVDEPAFRLYNGHQISRPYCPFILWTGKETVGAVCKMSDEELETDLHEMLWNMSPAEPILDKRN